MPELPEVETLRLQLSAVLPGLIIQKIEILSNKSFIGEKKLVEGKKIVGVRRFAKMLVIDLKNDLALVVHLKMTGQLMIRKNSPSRSQSPPGRWPHARLPARQGLLPGVHTRVIMTFTNGDKLFFNDMRKFGWMRIVRNKTMKQLYNVTMQISSIKEILAKLGPEPLRDLTLKKFVDILKSSRRPIKLVLMDQTKIAGVGNIYANESLFLAGIRPTKPANALSNGSIVSLLHCLERVLKNGIKWKGASKTNFVDIYGEKGNVQEHFLVYDREGQECLNHCGGKVTRIKLGGRGTFFCPGCQKY